MLNKQEFYQKIQSGVHFLDGATGSNLMRAGMPQGCCAEKWVLDNPQALIDLQKRYAEAGSQILYSPTFQAQPVGLQRVGMEDQTQQVNARLVQISQQAGPACLIAGDLTTLAAFMETWDEDNYDAMVENYRIQIRGLMAGGADLLIGETLLYPLEAKAIMEAASLENAGAVMLSFTMTSDGKLFSGQEAGPILHDFERMGAAAVGFNCVAAGADTPGLVSLLRRSIKGPLICKPNAGLPVSDGLGGTRYTMSPPDFAEIMSHCVQAGATLLGGCCGTDPEFIRAISHLF